MPPIAREVSDEKTPNTGVGLSLRQINNLGDVGFEKRLQEVYGPIVIYHHESSSEVNIAAMLRVKLHFLQRAVVEDTYKFKYSESSQAFGKDTGANLHEYGQIFRLPRCLPSRTKNQF